MTDEECEEAFARQLKKIENIRNTSSPILKVIQLWRIMDEMMGLMGEVGEIQDADVLFNMIFFCVATIQSEDNKYLGARFIEECSYIDAFLHEDQLDIL